MSTLTVSLGSSRSSAHVQRFGSTPSPTIENVHSSRETCGVGPADRTGKSSVTYCPGGTRLESTSGRRRPRKPRESGLMRLSLARPPWRYRTGPGARHRDLSFEASAGREAHRAGRQRDAAGDGDEAAVARDREAVHRAERG